MYMYGSSGIHVFMPSIVVPPCLTAMGMCFVEIYVSNGVTYKGTLYTSDLPVTHKLI